MKDPKLVGYATALNWQRKLHAFLESPEGEQHCWWLTSRQHNVTPAVMQDGYGMRKLVNWIAEKIDASLQSPAVYWIDPEMCGTLGEASEAMPLWTLQLDALPTPTGFCWLGRPMYVNTTCDGTEAYEPFRGFGWSVFYKAWAPEGFTYFNADGTRAKVVTHTTFDPTELDPAWRQETRLGVYFLLEEPDGRVIPGFMMEWPVGTDMPHLHHCFDDQTPAERDMWHRVGLGLLRYFSALCVFLQQEILVTRTAQVPRALQRHAPADRAITEPVVRVIALRKRRHDSKPGAGDGDPVDWSCQWVVSGHWRKQWYAKAGIHQPRWIAPYLKGPDDKPLKAPGRKVFAVVR